MIDVKEHIYYDDPRSGHPDVRTELKDVCYFFIGNGLIQGAVQHAPGGDGSRYGLLVMDPEELRTKRGSFTFDPGSGIEMTMLLVSMGEDETRLEKENLTVRWEKEVALPCVRVGWESGALVVSELFYCPDRSHPRIVRAVSLHNRSKVETRYMVVTGVRSSLLSREVRIDPGRRKEIFVIYDLDVENDKVDFALDDHPPAMGESPQYWKSAARVQTGYEPIDRLFRSASLQLPSMIARSGKIDSGIWQYTREWVRDQAFMAHAVLLCGHPELAGVMLNRLLREFISEDGSSVDSSAKREPDDVELDQNGILLYVLREYVFWTGDLSIVTSNWDRIVRTAEFPLQPAFREPFSGLLFNERDYWERHATYGIKHGMELVYQVFVSLGLSAAATLARLAGKNQEEDRWKKEASRIKDAVLNHRTHALISDGAFCKRRGVDGKVQRLIVPQPNANLPAEVGLARDVPHPLDPDSSCALPIVFGFVPAESTVAQETMKQLEALWNQCWSIGGYGRYHMDSDPDSPGPWPFASLFMARAYMEMRKYDKVERVAQWLARLPQYESGSYFEMYGARIAPPYAQNGIIPWTWAEILMLVMKNILGFQLEENAFRFRPRLLPQMAQVTGSLPFRDRRIFFSFAQDRGITHPQYKVDSKPVDAMGESVSIPFAGRDIHVEGRIPL